MVEHIGNRVKYLVEKKFKGSKKEFAEAIGYGEPNSLYKIFSKEDLGTELLRKIAEALEIPVVDILFDSDSLKTPKKDNKTKSNKVVVEFHSEEILNFRIDLKKKTLEIVEHK